MTKLCSKCGEEKLIEDFGVSRTRKSGRQNWCKPCMVKYQVIRQRENRHEMGSYLAMLKAITPCEGCGKHYSSECMDFDHVHGEKLFDISDAKQRHVSWEALKAEIAKCDIVCSNCHRSRTMLRSLMRMGLNPSLTP